MCSVKKKEKTKQTKQQVENLTPKHYKQISKNVIPVSVLASTRAGKVDEEALVDNLLLNPAVQATLEAEAKA